MICRKMLKFILKGKVMFSFEIKAVRKATAQMKKALGDNLTAVIAFGSRVRGDSGQESDFDILILVKKRSFKVIDAVNAILGMEEYKTGIPFSAVVKPVDTFAKEKNLNTPFYRSIKKEGTVIYGET